jgi:thymidylate synthase (FAD)
MTKQRLLAELERCDREISKCHDGVMRRVHPAEDLLGYHDWHVERRLIVKELMNIVEPYAHIYSIQGHVLTDPDAGVRALRMIEWAGRISHRSEDFQTDDTWKRFIEAIVLGHGDWSIVEHASATVDMLVDRGITHEIVRHRLFSFTQESTRFVNYEKKMPPSFIVPPDVGAHATGPWVDSIEQAELSYRAMLARGCTPQIARSVFPNALASRIVVTGNLRNWRHFLLMRTTKEAHPQMRQVTIPLLAEFKEKIPLLYDDLQPLMRQADAMRLPR